MADPISVLSFNHARFEIWPDSVRTIFKADGAEVVAAPNSGETLIDCAVHEALHHIVSQAKSDTPSACLRAVADGDAYRWTEDRREEESLCFGMGHLVVDLVRAIIQSTSTDQHKA